ncbi:MAG: GNAT family N-acetyltransferase [Anaerolineae bacterium]
MNLTVYPEANAFLQRAQATLEQDEVRSNLILGITLRLARSPAPALPPYLATVEDGGALALAAIITPPRHVLILAWGEAWREGAGLVAGDLAERGMRPPGVIGPAEVARVFADAYAARAGVAVREGLKECLYVLRQVVYRPDAPGRFRMADAGDIELVARWYGEFEAEALGEHGDPAALRELAETKIAAGDIALWDDGGPVALVGRTRPLRHGITIAPVYTPPSFRNRGYATACTATFTQALLDSGYAFCTLFTNLANPTANSIYQRIGYRPVAYFDEYRFA